MKSRGGDVFGDALVQYWPDLYRYALALARKTADAEEMVQETMRKALENRASFKEGTDIRSWLFSLQFNVHRTMLNVAVRKRNREAYDPLAFEAYPTPTNQDDAVLFTEARDLIERLPREQRHALYEVVFKGKSYQEVAKLLDCSEGTVKSRISRAKTALQAMVREPEPEPELSAAPRM